MAPGLRLIKVAVWNSRMGLVGCFLYSWYWYWWGELAHGNIVDSEQDQPQLNSVLRISFGHVLKNIAEGGLKFIGNLAGGVINSVAGKALGGLL